VRTVARSPGRSQQRAAKIWIAEVWEPHEKSSERKNRINQRRRGGGGIAGRGQKRQLRPKLPGATQGKKAGEEGHKAGKRNFESDEK